MLKAKRWVQFKVRLAFQYKNKEKQMISEQVQVVYFEKLHALFEKKI